MKKIILIIIMLFSPIGVQADFSDNFGDFMDNAGSVVDLWEKGYCVKHDCSNGVPKAPKQFKQEYRQNPERFYNNLSNGSVNFNNYIVRGRKCYMNDYDFCYLPRLLPYGSACTCTFSNGWWPGFVGN